MQNKDILIYKIPENKINNSLVFNNCGYFLQKSG